MKADSIHEADLSFLEQLYLTILSDFLRRFDVFLSLQRYYHSMLTLIITVLFAALFGYFATQNPVSVPVHFAGYSYTQVPLYVVMVVAALIGLIAASIISLINGLGTAFTLRGRDTKLKAMEHEVAALRKENDQLRERHHVVREENAAIKDETLAEKHPLLHNIKHSFS